MKKILVIISSFILIPSTIQLTIEKPIILEFNAQKGLTGYYNELNKIALVGNTRYTKVIKTPENSRPKKSKKHEFIGKLTEINPDSTTSQEFDLYGVKENTNEIDKSPDGTVRMVERTEIDELF